MQKTIGEIFSNKLGNVLALGHLTLIALNSSGLTLSYGLIFWIKFAFLISIPARLASALLFGEPLLPYWASAVAFTKFTFITLLFIYLQWIVIGWMTGKISRAIQPTAN